MNNIKSMNQIWTANIREYGTIDITDYHDLTVIHWTGFDSCDSKSKDKKRNAHLISATPDMYRALRDVLTECEQQQDGYYTANLTQYEVDAIRAALAKADGGIYEYNNYGVIDRGW